MKNINYTAIPNFREKQTKANHKVASLFGRNLTATFFLILFMVMDTVSMYQLWNTFLPPQANFILYILVFTIGVCLNLPASIAGTAIKECTQKLTSRKVAVAISCLALGAFALLFTLNAAFRIQTSDQLLELDAGSGLVSMVDDSSEESEDEAQEDNNATLTGALVMAVLPLATSVSSFIIGWKLSDPLDDKVYQMDMARVNTQTAIAELRAALEGVGDMDAYMDFMYQSEAAKHAAFSNQILSQRDVLKQAFRVLLMEYMKNPNSISYITENARKILQDNNIDLPQLSTDERHNDNTLMAA